MTQQSRKSKTRHRGHNEGSIRPTPNGTWRAWVTLKSGKRISKTLPTKSEARDWLQQKMTEGEEALDAERTLGEYMLEWFEYHSSQLKESTRSDYEILIRKYILPNLSEVALTDLHRSVFDKFYTSLQQAKVGDTQIRYIQRVIHKALRDAVQDRILAYNPSDGAKVPKKPKGQRISSPLSEMQAVQLVRVAIQHPIGPLIH